MKEYSGYITPSGIFIDIPETNAASDHHEYCTKHRISEDYLMEVKGYVKLTRCLCNRYIFRARTLTPEQVRTLEELGYIVDEYDKP